MANHSIVVADDHPVFRKGLIDIIKDLPGISVVAEAQDGVEAYQQITAKRPDLAILDIEMPHLTGIDVCAKVLKEKSATKFIVLTMHKDKDFYQDAMRMGVMGYVLKDNAIGDILACIQSVLMGQKYLSPGLEQMLVETKKTEHTVDLSSLTATEKIILKLIADQKTSAEIANLLFVSGNTIENHRSSINKKLQLEGKNSLLKFAIEHKSRL